MPDLLALTFINLHLSLLAIGGGNSVLPEMQRQVVAVHGWMSAQQFAALYALAQAAPGPNVMVVTLIGWRVSGLAGALAATFAFIVPPSVVMYFAGRLWYRHREARWRAIAQAGLTPVTVGLVLAASYLLVTATTISPATGLITAICSFVFLRSKLNPLWLLAAAAALGAIGVVQ